MAFCGIWECFEKIDFFEFLVTPGTTLAHRLPQHRDLADHVTDVTNVTMSQNLVTFSFFFTGLWIGGLKRGG